MRWELIRKWRDEPEGSLGSIVYAPILVGAVRHCGPLNQHLKRRPAAHPLEKHKTAVRVCTRAPVYIAAFCVYSVEAASLPLAQMICVQSFT